MEVLDIVDKTDKVIGKAPKNIIYEKKHPHRIVHVLIFNDEGKMALQLRSDKVKFCPNHWSTAAGGHVQSGETYEEAALREFEEELGVRNYLEMLGKDYYESEGVPPKFLATFKTNFSGRFDLNSEEVKQIEFFSMGQIKKMIENNEKFHPELLFLLNKYFF